MNHIWFSTQDHCGHDRQEFTRGACLPSRGKELRKAMPCFVSTSCKLRCVLGLSLSVGGVPLAGSGLAPPVAPAGPDRGRGWLGIAPPGGQALLPASCPLPCFLLWWPPAEQTADVDVDGAQSPKPKAKAVLSTKTKKQLSIKQQPVRG
jgi:hypothetical protein